MRNQARQEAERLFLRLRNKTSCHEGDTIVVNYAERFPPGKCVIAVTVPIRHQTLKTVIGVGMAHRKYHYPPMIINGRKARCLRLLYRFRGIKPEEHGRLLGCAKMLAGWAEDLFGMQAIVSPMKGLIGVRWRLRAF